MDQTENQFANSSGNPCALKACARVRVGVRVGVGVEAGVRVGARVRVRVRVRVWVWVGVRVRALGLTLFDLRMKASMRVCMLSYSLAVVSLFSHVRNAWGG